MKLEDVGSDKIKNWVNECAEFLMPDSIEVIDGSDSQKQLLINTLKEQGDLYDVDEKFSPNSYWTRSDPNDVARVEGRTFICSKSESDAGATNNWADPKEMKEKMTSLMTASMKGRKMYVIPYIMGPISSPYSKCGVQVTDSAYVALNMLIMTRAGSDALNRIKKEGDFVECVHSVGVLDKEERYICHFPEENLIMSFNSGYGGNALLGKKCFALRIASYLGKKEGWMAEHMLILGITNPEGEKKYICAAFPSACGKTNLAMLVPPKSYLEKGWKVETVGDDIAWLHFGEDGQLYAINPENGYFGVAPGTSSDTNPNMVSALKKGNCIFTNTAYNKESKMPWWDKMDGEKPSKLTSWLGNEWTPGSEEKPDHPNSRFTCPASQCPTIDPNWENSNGVPISAIIFGGRRAKSAPLVYEAFNWEHGTFVGATMASEMTAAAAGVVGKIRRDPMAMKPFIGYNVGDYLQHWLDIGKKEGAKLPKIFHVNWFRTDDNGKFMWPGFGENIRVLEWITKRIVGKVDSVDGVLGKMPIIQDINTKNLSVDENLIANLQEVKTSAWKDDIDSQEHFFKEIGDKLPDVMWREFKALRARLGI